MANKDKKNQTSFKEGNQAALIYTIEEAKKFFDNLLYIAINDNSITSLQKLYFSANIAPSTAFYLIEKFPELEKIKNDCNEAIIMRINDGALIGEKAGGYTTAAAIWRMKQLGEKDKQEIEQSGSLGIVWNETKTYEADQETN